jgi:hypothetical protein
MKKIVIPGLGLGHGLWNVHGFNLFLNIFAMYPHEYKNLHGKPRWAGKMSRERERKKIHTVRPAGLKPRRSFSYTKITKSSCFDCAVALCTMQNELLVISNLTWLDFRKRKILYDTEHCTMRRLEVCCLRLNLFDRRRQLNHRYDEGDAAFSSLTLKSCLSRFSRTSRMFKN